MYNIFWAWIALGICGYGFYKAFVLTKAGAYDKAVFIICACGLILRVFVGSDLFLHEWDERYHALVAKHFLNHFWVPTLYDKALINYDYKSWTTNHYWLHKPPMALWLMAISIKLFGLHAFSVRLPAILLTTLSIKLMYDIAASWFDNKTGVLAAFFFSIHGLILELAGGRVGTDAVDAVFLSFILLSVWLATKTVTTKKNQYLLFFGIALGFGILTKWLMALIAIPVWMVWAYPSYKDHLSKFLLHLVEILAVASLVAMPWQYYIYTHFPKEAHFESWYNRQHFWVALEAHSGDFFYYFDHLRMQYGELIYLPIIWFTWKGIKNKNPNYLAVLVWFWLTFLFFSLAATKMEAYTLIAAPAVFIMNAQVVLIAYDWISNTKKPKYLLVPLVIGLLGLPIRYSLERLKPFTMLDRKPNWYQQIDSIRTSPINLKTTILYNTTHPIETMFFTDCVAYQTDLDTAQIRLLKQKGFFLVRLGGSMAER